MKFRRLGRSDLHVPEIRLGSWLTYGFARGPRGAGAVNEALEEVAA